MKWLVSTEIDTEEELIERMNFYSGLRKRELSRNHKIESLFAGWLYAFDDGNADNRFMIIGHSDFPIVVINMLKKSIRRRGECFKFFVCACLMSSEIFHSECNIEAEDEVYVTLQKLEDIEGSMLYTCEYLDKTATRMGFRATKSELSLGLPGLAGRSFYGNLKRCFMPLQRYVRQG
jgi:hypothetical protein